jgi:hypothetical protein
MNTPTRPADHAPEGRSYQPRHTALLLVCLMLITLAPRAVLGYRRAVLSSDAVFFVEQAMALDRGDTTAALEKLGLNVYPFLLMGLHRTGLSWEAAGELSSLAFSVLTVLPLFAWVSRLFDRRAAVCACLLWACHVEAVEWGPVTIRDAMFWFEMNVSLLFSLEAARRAKLSWYAAAWAVIGLAFLTRIEGVLLVIPLAWWSATLGDVPRRLPQLARFSVAALMVPLLIVAMNVTLLRHHDRWEWGRLAHVQIVYRWVGGAWAHDNDVSAAATSQPTQQPDVGSARFAQSQAGVTKVTSEMSPRAMFWGYRHALWWGVGPIYVVLMTIGLARFDWLRHWRQQLPLLLVAGAVLVCIWMYLWFYHDTTKRYAVTVVIPLLPYASLGLSKLAEWMTQLVRWMTSRWGATAGVPSSVGQRRISAAAFTTMLGCIVAVSMIDAVNDNYHSREACAELGTWVAERFGHGRTMLCTEDIERLVGYYAGATHEKIPSQVHGPGIGRWVDRLRPELVVLWLESPGVSAYEEFLATARAHGYTQVDNNAVPQDLGTVRVFVRQHGRLASRPQ